MAIPRRRVSGRHTLFYLLLTVDGSSPRRGRRHLGILASLAGMIMQLDVASCAGIGDDEITLMSAGIFPRLEGGIRAALDEADSL